jgi:hypothetical protein
MYPNSRNHLQAPTKRAENYEDLKVQEDLLYPEDPIRITDETERITRLRVIKCLMVQWKNHSESEATWECEDWLKSEYPSLFPTSLQSRGRDFCNGGRL